MPKDINDEIEKDELDLEQEQRTRERSRDDELERERTVDGEEIYYPEQEEPVEEEAYDPTQEEENDEYYEDMFEEDWEEVEAKEQARKEKEEEKAKKKAQSKAKEKRIKARREEQRKKEELLRQEEARRREREQLEAAQKDKKGAPSHEEVPVVPVPGQVEEAPVQKQEPVPEDVVHVESPATPQTTPHVEVAVESEQYNVKVEPASQPAQSTQTVVSEPVVSQQTDTKQNTPDYNMDQDSLYEEQKKEAFNRQMEEQERVKEAAAQKDNVGSAEPQKTEPTAPIGTVQQEPPVYVQPQAVQSEQVRNEAGPVLEPVRAPVYEDNSFVREEHRQTSPAEPEVAVKHEPVTKTAPEVTLEDAYTVPLASAPETEKTAPVAPVIPEAAGSNADFHQQMVEGVENAEYSREHQKQQYEQREQLTKEDAKQQEEVKGVPAKEDNVPFVAPHAAGGNNASKSVDVFGLPEEEKPFYNDAGIPTSVVDAAAVASIAPKVAHAAVVSETIIPDIGEAVVSEAAPKAAPRTQNEEPFARFENDFGVGSQSSTFTHDVFDAKEPISNERGAQAEKESVSSTQNGAFKRPVSVGVVGENEQTVPTGKEERQSTAKTEQEIPFAPNKDIVGQREQEIVGQGKTVFDKDGVPVGVETDKNGILADKIDKSVYDRLSMPDYVKAAQTVIADYEVEIVSLNTKLDASREKLKNLKDNGGSAAEIKAIRDSIRTDNDKLQLILKDKERVNDFLQNGPRTGRHITKDDVLNAEYSRGHKAEVKAGQAGAGDEVIGGPGSDKKMFYSSADLKKVHQGRIRQALGNMGGRVGHGVKGAARRVLAEEDDLNEEAKVIETTNDIRVMMSSHLSMMLVDKELKTLGLDKATMNTALKEMGIITGVGDVSKMKLFDMKEALVKGGGKAKNMQELMELLSKNGSTLSAPIQKQLLEAIELKEKLGMGNIQLARLAIRDAGEFAGWSKSLLKKELKGTTDIIKKKQLEAALKYHKLNKVTNFASKRWVFTRGLVGGALEKVLRNNEHLADAIGIGRGSVTAYKVSRVVVRTTAHASEATAEGAKKAAKWTEKKIVGLHNKFDMAQRNAMLQQQGMRKANLLGNDVNKATKFGLKNGGSKFSQSKIGQAFSRTVESIKSGLSVAGKALIGAAKGIAAAVAAIAGGAGVFLIVLLLIFAVLIGVVYLVVLGDDGAHSSIFDRSTSVPEMVEYLEEKNEAWLQEIDELVNAQPTTLDKHGDQLREYTKVHYTYYDATGHTCMTTNNTKEIISMAAVYFEQDFSDGDKVYEYIDELWEKSHIITTSETPVYNEGMEDICFTDDGQFVDPNTQGFNGHERKFYCTEDYNNISYNDCYEYEPESAYREYLDKNSFRFADGTDGYYKYSGINMLTEGDTRGYGCQEETGRFYCTSINSISNTEVLVKLVDSTGINYSTLSQDRGCEQKHTTDGEGEPVDGCDDASVYYRTYSVGWYEPLPSGYYYDFVWNSDNDLYEWNYIDSEGVSHTLGVPGNGTRSGGRYNNVDSFVVSYDGYENGVYWYNYSIPYYSCNEKTCSGHLIAYHTCSGHEYSMEHLHGCLGGSYRTCPEHLEKVCHGHVDLNINLEIRGFERNWLFMTAVDCDNGFLWDTEDEIQWATDLRDQDWKDLYGVEIPASIFDDDEHMGSVVMPSHANALPIPLYNQLDYNTPYGAYGTVASHGCGITCIAMVTAYHRGEDVSPAWMGRTFGNYNTSEGSLWSVFAGTAPDLGIPFEKQTSSWEEVVEALQNGKPVISIQNGNGPFTSGGHFILLTGITADGKILVNDPYGANYYKSELIPGFRNGFNQSDIRRGSDGAYWIYGAKETS